MLAEELRRLLPADYLDALKVLVASLGPELREDQGIFNDSWFLMPVARFVEEYGLDHPHQSLAAIEAITRRHTGEYAIRPFLKQHHDLTMRHVRQWAASESHNVRRLASEGIRPRLPWAGQHRPFIDDPAPVLEIIDALTEDPSAFVRTSVANNLNDISKDHPDLAVATAERWLAREGSDRTAWIVDKGLRTLVKAGHPGALRVLGAEADPTIAVSSIEVDPTAPAIGENMTITAVVANDGDGARDVIVDYRIHFRRADGSMKPVTFKMGRVHVEPGARVEVTKRHPFRLIKTRTYHPGLHGLTVQANGSESDVVHFTLRAGDQASGRRSTSP
ncbi:DNA alkylation repair protein [uncultured Corynebacterium sp.]|uniref:DNA alkylation repair protein n=1 Tax=uncultured Corynebacterium sp. TaxID=159447 RepID=UPI0025FCECD6|nr:DNA alkylation repair protein [uncultured Corynebacterium sp.]